MIEPPLALIAELTHACPLRCVYCSNPTELAASASELGTDAWLHLIEEAAELGVLQLHLTGGEPLCRGDLERLVDAAAQRDLYANLITSGIGLDDLRARRLAAAGLRHVQLSVQSDEAAVADAIAGRRAHAAKLVAAETVRRAGMVLSINVVVHRHNLDRLDAIIDLAVRLGAERVELANVQYYGWALLNRRGLLPTRDQLARAEAVLRRRRSELRGRVELVWVLPDYHEASPKPCMGGWARRSVTVTPAGAVQPCPAAGSIPGLRFESVREHPLAWIWEHSAALNAFRGVDWMPAPCRTCERRHLDFGGCRCQAAALTGDAGRTDPACGWAPDHHLVEAAVAEAEHDAHSPSWRVSMRQMVHRGAPPTGAVGVPRDQPPPGAAASAPASPAPDRTRARS